MTGVDRFQDSSYPKVSASSMVVQVLHVAVNLSEVDGVGFSNLLYLTQGGVLVGLSDFHLFHP